MATASGKPMRVYSVSTEGGSPEQMIPGDGNEWDPGWSKDGNWLVFHTEVEAGTPPTAEIRLLDLRTHQLSTLPGSQGLYGPRWSPDGKYIAALQSGPEYLWLYDFKSQKWEELTSIGVGYPSWSQDSNSIYFDNIAFQREVAFFRVHISDHKLEQVTSLKDLQPYGILDLWTGLTPDDSPLLSRNVSSQEIYALNWEAR
jgi:Tol biopolymer transport system component